MDRDLILKDFNELIDSIKHDNKPFYQMCRQVQKFRAGVYKEAFAAYLRTGYRDAMINKILDLTESSKDFLDIALKYDPNQPRVPAGNADGGQ